MTLIQQFGFVTPIDCKERNVKPSHKCPFSDKLSLLWTTITRTTLFCFATDILLSFLKASEVRWNLTRGIWAFVFAFHCCTPGPPEEQRAQEPGWLSQPAGVAQLTACTSLHAQRKDSLSKCLSSSYAWQLKELLPFYMVNRCLYFYIMG